MKTNILLTILLILVGLSSTAQNHSEHNLTGAAAQNLYQHLKDITEHPVPGYGTKIAFSKHATVECFLSSYKLGDIYTCYLDDLNIKSTE